MELPKVDVKLLSKVAIALDYLGDLLVLASIFFAPLWAKLLGLGIIANTIGRTVYKVLNPVQIPVNIQFVNPEKVFGKEEKNE